MTPYSIVLTVHSLLRWAVIAAGLLAVVGAWRAAGSTRPGAGSGRAFTILFDVQLLVGLTLYFLLSPITAAAIHQFGAAMSNEVARFWAVEHPFGMIVALAFAHIGHVKSRRSDQRRRAAIYLTLAVIVIIVSVPWPGRPYGRPLI